MKKIFLTIIIFTISLILISCDITKVKMPEIKKADIVSQVSVLELEEFLTDISERRDKIKSTINIDSKLSVNYLDDVLVEETKGSTVVYATIDNKVQVSTSINYNSTIDFMNPVQAQFRGTFYNDPERNKSYLDIDSFIKIKDEKTNIKGLYQQDSIITDYLESDEYLDFINTFDIELLISENVEELTDYINEHGFINYYSGKKYRAIEIKITLADLVEVWDIVSPYLDFNLSDISQFDFHLIIKLNDNDKIEQALNIEIKAANNTKQFKYVLGEKLESGARMPVFPNFRNYREKNFKELFEFLKEND